MADRFFDGFGELPLAASELGARHEPCVLLLPDRGQTRTDWLATAEALADAGRHVIAVDLRGQGESNVPPSGQNDVAAMVGDCMAVLRQLSSRPVVVGAGLGGLIAAIALGEGEPDLASGLVLVDGLPQPDDAESGSHAPSDEEAQEIRGRAQQAAGSIRTPVLHLHAGEMAASTAEVVAGLRSAEVRSILSRGENSSDPLDAFNAALIEFLERRVPLAPPEYVAGSDPRTLREALGTFATGVTVVTTTGANGERVGLTANSFTSVSLDPPLLLVCPARDAGSTEILSGAEHFAVNVLHIGQQAVSDLFATKGEDRFAATDCETWDHGVPIIRNSLASFECRRYAEYDGGDHIILVGEVLRVRYAPQRDPLLYFRGRYRRLHFG